MKNLVGIFLFVILSILVSNIHAQNIGVRGGLNFANVLAVDNDQTYRETQVNPGIHFGVTADFVITNIISFETGLFYSEKGLKIIEKETDFGVTYQDEYTTNLTYIELPLTAKASFEIAGAKVFGLLGPYFGMGIGGNYKEKIDLGSDVQITTRGVNWGSSKNGDDVKRLDYGLLIGAGAEFRSIQVGLSYGLGLANISPYTDYGSKANNRVLALSVGYVFFKR